MAMDGRRAIFAAATVLSLALGCASAPPQSPLPPFPAALGGAVGCWEMRALPPAGYRVEDVVVVRLDSVVRMLYGDTLIFAASGLQGLGRDRQDVPHMFWRQASPADSLEVGAAGVSGLVWRLGLRGDRVAGTLYTFSDLGFGLELAGPVAGRRLGCPA
jgi:hypothetical protein